VFAFTKDENGPYIEDSVDILYLNIDSGDLAVSNWLLTHKGLRQPWLGFGHADEYLKHDFPVPINQVTP
jgi:hypothetical protein